MSGARPTRVPGWAHGQAASSGPGMLFCTFKARGAKPSWLGSLAQVEEPNLFARALVGERVSKTQASAVSPSADQ